MLLALVDYWVIHRGKIAAYSEEDELLKKVQEEERDTDAGGKEMI